MDRGQSIQVLDRVVSWLTDNKEDAHKLFLECTASGRAYLPSSGLGEFVRRVEPEAGDADRRLVVANIVRRIQVRLSKPSLTEWAIASQVCTSTWVHVAYILVTYTDGIVPRLLVMPTAAIRWA